jgi:hypothetical protein
MIKIGIVGADKKILRLIDLIRTIEGVEITGYCMNNEIDNSLNHNLLSYQTIEALFRYTDAVVLSHGPLKNVSIICKCLKHFKHVFLFGAQYLQYDDFTYLEKIAEESNVRFYPDFGTPASELLAGLCESLKDVQYIDLNHTFSATEGICDDGRLSLALLRDLNFLTDIVRVNIKKVTANGWGFCEPGAGMLNANIDFDNGAAANMLLVNSVKPRQLQIVLYGKSEIVRINLFDNTLKVTKESLTMGQTEDVEYKTSFDSAMKHEFKQFLSAIHSMPAGYRSIENKYSSMRMTHLIHEKINHFSSIGIFYS